MSCVSISIHFSYIPFWGRHQALALAGRFPCESRALAAPCAGRAAGHRRPPPSPCCSFVFGPWLCNPLSLTLPQWHTRQSDPRALRADALEAALEFVAQALSAQHTEKSTPDLRAARTHTLNAHSRLISRTAMITNCLMTWSRRVWKCIMWRQSRIYTWLKQDVHQSLGSKFSH